MDYAGRGPRRPQSAELHHYLFAQAMALSHDLATIIDLEGRITYANPAVSDVLGFRPDEVVGRFLWDVIRDADRIGELMLATKDHGQWAGELVFLHRLMGEVPLWFRTVLVQTKEGEVLGVVGMGWDITARKRVEDQLVRIERQRLLGEMAGGVAHDFNNSLTMIMGHAQMLEADPVLPESAKRALGIIIRSAERAGELAGRLQPGSDLHSAPPTALDINELVESCVETTRPRWERQAQAEGRKINVVTDLRARATIDGRSAEMDEVLTNLIFNAVDAMPRGGRITLRTWEESQFVCLAVADSGVGMDEATRRNLGKLFFTTKGEKGHGLGLAACYRIVEDMSGRIVVESTVDLGTTFNLVFPNGRIRSVEDASGRANQAVSARVLIVEDDEEIHGLLTAALENCEVEFACDGRTGVDLFRKRPHDIVLLDLSMPGMSGVDVAQKVKAMAPDVPIVLMTGWGSPPEGSEGLFHSFIKKPFFLKDLRSHLAAIR